MELERRREVLDMLIAENEEIQAEKHIQELAIESLNINNLGITYQVKYFSVVPLLFTRLSICLLFGFENACHCFCNTPSRLICLFEMQTYLLVIKSFLVAAARLWASRFLIHRIIEA